MNYYNEEKCYGISTDFIRKLTDFFIIIGGKHQKISSLSRCMALKIVGITCLYRPMCLELDDYPPYSDKKIRHF